MRISVVIPVRDDAIALEGCLAALARQSRAPDEILVVDSGSIDGSAEIAARHGARVLAVHAPGIPGATAAALDAAVGDVLARLDADTVPPPQWVGRIEAAFAADPRLDAISGAATFYGGTWLVRYLGRKSLTVGYFRLIAALLGHAPLYGSNFAMRADLWRRMRLAVHRDRADVHDDVDLSLHLPPGSAVRYDPQLTVGVSARSFTRPRGTRGQIGMTARTLLVTSRETGLMRLRLAWFLAALPTGAAARGPLGRLERRTAAASRRGWRRLLRRFPRR
ncbi:glycosyltransferase family A protein [Agrococcus sp. BE272]|uniref:glycosyltransferase family 2 protein n=1 Tax=Agrococcus sp. BE272 TaxID=2817727 RepID=UPI00286358CC|nr:glycosyltransferase family A protein [Agrococcus sp. BE272]MDR7235151.1 glycosyltransferase involved in cell wall biosynthesis [Agrococcus sp. BE272]